jgi:hypothetical protein
MDKNLSIIARNLFGKLRTQFPKIQLGDQNSKVTDRPKDARYFEFDYIKHGKNLGTITISISDKAAEDGEDDGLVVIFSNDIVEGQPEGVKRQWFRFLESLSDFASQHMMDFNVRDIAKSNLDKRDYETLSNNSGVTGMTESKLWGTSRTSFQEMGEAKLIVKHSKPVNYDLPAGRTMHIESIYVESAEGERFRYPYKHLNGARALAMHVAHGGTSYDDIGQHIISLSEELNKLRMFKGYVDRNPVVSEAMGPINGRVYERIDSIKKEIHSLQNQKYYESFAESFTKSEEQMIPEDIVNDWIDRLTIRSFNEELKNVFPYIYKLVGENVAPVKELGPEDLIQAETFDATEVLENEIEELQDFEGYLNRLVSENSDLLDTDEEAASMAVQKLNTLIAQEMPAGVDGTNAIQSLKGIIDDSDLISALKELGKVNPEMDVRDVIKGFLEKHDEENGTDIATKINFGSTTPEPTAPAPAAPEQPAAPVPPEAAAAPAPATPEQPAAPPVAESAFERAIKRAIAAGATEDTMVTLSGQEMSIAEAVAKAGFKVEQFFESKINKQVVEFVKSMYDENTGSFPKGETGVMIAVEKEFGEDALNVAKGVISELSMVYESKRLRQLAGLAY